MKQITQAPAAPTQGSHTPGPWHARDRGIGWEVHIGAACQPTGWCDAVNDGFRETFSEADARLIAAAPEMLTALKIAEVFIAEELETREGSDIKIYIAQARNSLREVRAAIAAAEGR